jgi:hypothetical protein
MLRDAKARDVIAAYMNAFYCVKTPKVLLLAMIIALAETEAGIGSKEKNSTGLKSRGSSNHPGV